MAYRQTWILVVNWRWLVGKNSLKWGKCFWSRKLMFWGIVLGCFNNSNTKFWKAPTNSTHFIVDLLVNIDSHERYGRPTFYESRGNEDYGDVFTIKIRALTRSRSTKTWIKPNIDENPIWRRFFRWWRWLLKSPRLQEFYFYGKRMLYGWFYPNMNMLNKLLPTKIMWHAHFAWHFGPEWALFSNYYLSLQLSNR